MNSTDQNSIDLNCDMGESAQAVASGEQESLMPFLTSVNIACGGHAGDAATMQATVEQGLRWKLALGAHPGYPDPTNFGRVKSTMPAAQVADWVWRQVSTLAAIAAKSGGRLTHVKPHGALYNQAVSDRTLAAAIAAGVACWSRNVTLVGLAGSAMLGVFQEAGFPVAAEAFADRRYQADGSLRPRNFNDALIHDPAQAARQALQIVQSGTVQAVDGAPVVIAAQTICIHGDTPGAGAIAEAVANALRGAGITLQAVAPP